MRFDIPLHGAVPIAGWWLIYGDAQLVEGSRQFWILKLPVFKYGEIYNISRDEKTVGWEQLAIGRTRSITGKNDAEWRHWWITLQASP